MSANNDPFAPENAHALNFIMQARIYDVLIALLRDSDEEAAMDVLETHFKGKLITPPPWWDGTFLTEE